MPDLTVILDIDPQIGLRRRRLQRDLDRLEAEELAFHERVREEFRRLGTRRSNRAYVLVNADRPADQVAADIRTAVAPLLARRLEVQDTIAASVARVEDAAP